MGILNIYRYISNFDYSLITLMRPTSSLSKRTLMPYGWFGDLIKMSFTIPSVKLPPHWSCFKTIDTNASLSSFLSCLFSC